MPNAVLRAAAGSLRAADRERHVELVGEDQRLGARVDALPPVVRDQLLAPVERIARVVARAVEELAEVHVEIAQEGVHAVGVGERDAEVAAVFLRPLVEGEDLRVAQPRPERLAGLHVLVRHRAERRQVVLAWRTWTLLGAGELLPDAVALAGLQHLLLPCAREAPTRAVVRDPELERRASTFDRLDLGLQGACGPRRNPAAAGRAEVHLRHDREHRDLEQDGVQPRAPDRDVDLAALLARWPLTWMNCSLNWNRPRKSTKSLFMKRKLAQVVELASRKRSLHRSAISA